MSQTIRAPIDTIRKAADTINTYTDDNSDLFTQILNLVNSVESCGDWKGQSMKTLQRITEKNKKKFTEGMGDLAKLGAFLKKYADAMEKTDVEQKRTIEKI